MSYIRSRRPPLLAVWGKNDLFFLPAGAEAKLKDANQRGPHWADPLKVWGDLLAKQGNAREALVK